MTKVFLAAGVAALAIAAPASAGPGGHGGDRTARTDRVQQRATTRQATVERQRPARTEVQRPSRVEMQSARADSRASRMESRATRIESRQAERAARVDTRQAARIDRNAQVQARQAERQQVRASQVTAIQDRAAARQQMRADRIASRPLTLNPTGKVVAANPTRPTAVPMMSAERLAALKTARVERINSRFGTSLAAPATAAALVGMPVAQATTVLPLTTVPQSISYLYPSTPDYYYRYNNGYVYQVDSTSNLISALIPLLAGGYLPGQYLPSSYMNSYVPSSYGFNSFYPNTPYQCTRYANGVIYYVDCVTGMIQDVQPIYDNGYGVGQLLPSSYSYYNVPNQYRSLYYDSADAGYWYAPGAIYQYDPQSSLITSVAALLAPGMSIGQPLPMGYSAYNVPYSYRDTYYDTPNAWYRYNNGYIYQVDPKTQLVSAIVASILT